MDNSVRPCDAKSLRAEKSASSDQHRSETDQTVKSGDKLRHRRHRDLTRDDETDNAANDNSADDFDQARNVVRDESGCDRNGHARHAEAVAPTAGRRRSEEHTSELQSLMRISYAVFCLKKKKHEITY